MIRNLLLCILCLTLIGCYQDKSSSRSNSTTGGGKAAPIVKITSDNFESVVLNNSKPVLVDCWAPWCGPCKILAPTIEDLARQFDGQVTVAKMNIDENTDQAAEYRITAIPTVLIFKDGKVAATRVGVQPKGNYESDLESLLGN